MSLSKERQGFIDNISELAHAIGEAASNPETDPGKLLYLTALGIQSCLVGIATLLQEGERIDDLQRESIGLTD